jgi:hypothetical protein
MVEGLTFDTPPYRVLCDLTYSRLLRFSFSLDLAIFVVLLTSQQPLRRYAICSPNEDIFFGDVRHDEEQFVIEGDPL